ncbi:hypothetical protein [Nocardia mexicana]|uniref:DUF4254 domain-containing protein n=1 Tax=Nocardia mexicana TaxID=279262 RepID=A0A370H4M1_9NOCA|nr:hypothetical protein [Nocardia mexicana]RDI51149.1 hypothetical protein DFR68_105627 [Nocardia mexicana]
MNTGLGTLGLPSKDLLLAALRGMPHSRHPMLEAASELAILHRHRLRTPPATTGEVDRQRSQLVLSIDRYVLFVTPVPHDDAPLHAESIGTLVDHLAWHCVDAHITHADDTGAHDEAVLLLNTLADDYDTLADKVTRGIRRLPITVRPDSHTRYGS